MAELRKCSRRRSEIELTYVGANRKGVHNNDNNHNTTTNNNMHNIYIYIYIYM